MSSQGRHQKLSPKIAKLILELVPKSMRYIRTEMRHSMAVEAAGEKDTAKYNLTIPQFRVLVKLSKGQATHKAVAEWLGVTPATLTRMVDTLVARNLLERTSHEQDRRQIYLNATAEGKSLYDRYRKKTQSKLEDQLEHLSSTEKQTLCAGLEIFAQVFKNAEED